MKLLPVKIAALLLSTVAAVAQSAPFDMSPEKPPAPPQAAPAQPAPAAPQGTGSSTTQQPTPAAPRQAAPAMPPRPAPETPQRVAPATPTPALPQPTPTQVARPEPENKPATATKRFLVPFPELTLEGESTRRSWSVYLTPDQAASSGKLHLAYQNAIVVAPEVSALRFSINGYKLLDLPLAAPDRSREVAADIPPNLLRPGLNDIVIEAEQRHRTDCSIQSTYELWTQIETAGTFLTFDSPEAGRWKKLDDLRAVGVDQTGSTSFNFIAPSLEQNVATEPIIRLAEGLAVLANMPNQSFDLKATHTVAQKPGEATVVIGTAAELETVLGALPAGAQTAPTVAVMDDARTGPSTLVVTGPDWPSVKAAVDDIAGQFDRPAANQRASLSTQNWYTPDIPLMFDPGRVKLAELGVRTQEFPGRRLRTEFSVGVPSDFYANAYGQVTLLLDAAYSDEVKAGSHIDIYVNGNIAATVPITTSEGEILRHLPVKVTMRHFRPGANFIAIEAVLLTEKDAVCLPGATASTNDRFVLFDSSEFVMPAFARIGRTPNLSGISGTAFPYNRAEYETPLLVDRSQPAALSAAATLLARLSVAAGRPIPIDTTAQPAAVTDRNAIFIGAITQLPPSVLAQLGVSNDVQSTWGETVASIGTDTDATFNQWREKLRGSGWRGQIGSLEEWLGRTFDVSVNSFRLLPGQDPLFTPQGSASLLVAQQKSPAGEGTWTLVSAPNDNLLRDGVRSLVQQSVWRQMGGRITTVDAADDKVVSLPVSRFTFVETQPFSLSNYRLIFANWLSANALSYSVLLTIISIMLGLATAGLLRSLGRER